MKKLILTLLIAITFVKVNAQTPDLRITPEGLMDTVFDRFGEKEPLINLMMNSPAGYTLNLLRPAPSISCTAGYYNLYFAPGSVFTGTNGAAYRNVVCNVFTDLSNLVNSPLSAPGNTVKVNVYCDNTTGGSLAVGVANPYHFYMNTPANPNTGVSYNATQQTILSGIDAYTGVTTGIFNAPGFYH